MVAEFREWAMLVLEFGIFYFVAKEFYYDKGKDEAKKQKRTRTTKRTTQAKDGSSVTEESVEVSEPITDREIK